MFDLISSVRRLPYSRDSSTDIGVNRLPLFEYFGLFKCLTRYILASVFYLASVV